MLVANIYGEATQIEETVRSGIYDIIIINNITESKSLFLNVQGVILALDDNIFLQLSTLRFASRMKCVQTDPAVNEHVDLAVSSLILHIPHNVPQKLL